MEQGQTPQPAPEEFQPSYDFDEMSAEEVLAQIRERLAAESYEDEDEVDAKYEVLLHTLSEIPARDLDKGHTVCLELTQSQNDVERVIAAELLFGGQMPARYGYLASVEGREVSVEEARKSQVQLGLEWDMAVSLLCRYRDDGGIIQEAAERTFRKAAEAGRLPVQALVSIAMELAHFASFLDDGALRPTRPYGRAV